MNTVFTIQYLFLLLCAAIATQLVLYAWQRRPAAGSTWFVVTMLGVAIWALAYALEMTSTSLDNKLIWNYVKFVGLALVPLAWLLFVLEFSGRWHWWKRPYLLALSAPTLLTYALSLSNDQHQLLWQTFAMPNAYGTLEIAYGPWFIGYVVLSYLYLLAGAIAMFNYWQEQNTALYRWQILGLLLGVLLPGMANILFQTRVLPIDLTPFSFVLAGMLLLPFAFRLRLFDINPIAHRLLVDSMEEGVLVVNRQNRIVGLNPAGAQLLRLQTDAVIGQPVDHVWPELTERLDGTTEKCVEIGPTGTENVYYEVSLSPLHDRRNEFKGRVLLVHDITARKERELLQQDMTRAMVHDLRAPISNSLFALEMLKTAVSDFVSPDDQMLLEMTHANTEKTLQLVNQILDVHRLESGKIPLSFSRISLSDIIHETLQAQQGRIEQKNLNIVCDVSASLSPAWADADLLRRVLQNLVDNAIKYSPEGGKICVSARLGPAKGDTETQLLLVSVADEGPGIPHALQTRIFDKFVTGEDEGSGSGLGLPFCQMAIAAHGQHIWIDSQSGEGAVFTFSLAAPASP